MNYVTNDTSSTIDSRVGVASIGCSPSSQCIRLHNGQAIFYYGTRSFGGTNTTNGILFLVDPDGVLGSSGTADGPSKSIGFILYYNGALTTYGYPKAGTADSNGSFGGSPSADPSWFNW
jgi:hypothetical protein